MTILWEKETPEEIDFDYEETIAQVMAQAAKQENCPYEFEVNLTMTDNEGIRELNREFRQLDVPTDVLSFPMIEYERPGDFSHLDREEMAVSCFHPETGELLLGDIVISVERAKEQAKEYGHSLKREICFLIAHSMLHLFGYDHIQEDERAEMEAEQKEIMNQLGIHR